MAQRTSTPLPAAQHILPLTRHLFTARLRQRDGSGMLSILSITALTVATAITTIVASGSWMFHQRNIHPTGFLADVLAEDPTWSIYPQFIFGLSLVACAILIVPLISLTAQAAVLGAKMREERLAVLRLLGLTRGEVNRIAALESMGLAAISTIIGLCIGILCLPLLTHNTMMAQRIQLHELLMPWWLYGLVALAILAVSLLATLIGLARVNISPLGVARKQPRPALRWWRPIFAAMVIVSYPLLVHFDGFHRLGDTNRFLLPALLLIMFYLAYDAVTPFILQRMCRLIARVPWVHVSWSARQVSFNIRTVWSRVKFVGLLIFLAAWVAPMKFGATTNNSEKISHLASQLPHDIQLGFFYTLLFTIILVAVSVLITQCANELEERERTIALQKMGIAPRVGLTVSWITALGPMLLSSLVALGLGLLASMPFAATQEDMLQYVDETQQIFSGVWSVVGFIALNVVIVVAALLATLPVRRQVLATAAQQRHAD